MQIRVAFQGALLGLWFCFFAASICYSNGETTEVTGEQAAAKAFSELQRPEAAEVNEKERRFLRYKRGPPPVPVYKIPPYKSGPPPDPYVPVYKEPSPPPPPALPPPVPVSRKPFPPPIFKKPIPKHKKPFPPHPFLGKPLPPTVP